MESQTITLADGRQLGFQLLGDPDGRPLFFFHGTPGSRLVLSEGDLLAQIPGVRLILPDRPGYGISDPQPGRALVDWPGDVAQLADQLALGSFAVAGESGGGPHALACAYRLADRVTRALVLASPSPTDFPGASRGMALGNRIALVLGRNVPWLVRWLIRGSALAFEKNPEGFIDALARQMATSDQALLADASFRQAMIRDFREAYRQGGEAQAVDGALTMTSQTWGFRLREISVPVHLWHGEEDTLVTQAMASYLTQEIPDCRAHFVAGAGHLLTDMPGVIEQMERVLGANAP